MSFMPYTGISDIIDGWRNGTLDPVWFLCFDNTANSVQCSEVCLDPFLWFFNFFQCLIYPTISKAFGAELFTANESAHLHALGYNQSTDDFNFKVAWNYVSCMIEYCELTPGCTDNPSYATVCLEPISNIDVFEAIGNLSISTANSSQLGPLIPKLDVVTNCINNVICNVQPPTNTDISGIGVFASFVIQSGMAILVLVLLAGWSLPGIFRGWMSSNHHIRAVVTAAVEFQKAQCYFAIAIQIASLIYIRQLYLTAVSSGYNNIPGNFQTVGLCLVVSTIGHLPVSFILTCLTYFHRHSWYLIAVSLCSYVLSTCVLFYGNHVWTIGTTYYSLELVDLNGVLQFPACAYNTFGGFPGPSYVSCEDFDMSYLPGNMSHSTLFALLVAMWAISTVWIAVCIWEITKPNAWTSRIVQSRCIVRIENRCFWISRITQSTPIIHLQNRIPKNMWMYFHRIFFVLTWTMSFTCQFYIYIEYLRTSGFVSTSWTFGQIVAITVWATCLVEYLNLEVRAYSRSSTLRQVLLLPCLLTVYMTDPEEEGHDYRLPLDLKVTRDPDKQPIASVSH
ncbi:hypothetical protein EG329_012705 [Mollisiaceae sp. DMI_Dod_QoI]|nr:hypothetical protein EG329_012705 [Helotiales sp. DMI_Dod_QoI]